MQIPGSSATALRGRVVQRNDCLGLHGQLPHFQMKDVGLHFRTSLVLTSEWWLKLATGKPVLELEWEAKVIF